jgi:tetratricopeptide (TPR) repeat protein
MAETYLRKSLELDQKNLQTILTLANCLSLQERYHEAGELFTKALSRDYYALRDYLVPIITYTYIYDRQYEKAERFLRNLLDSDPGSDVIRISLAVAMNMQGTQKSKEAKNELAKIVAKADSPPLLKTYASNLLKNFDKWHDVSCEK